LDIAKLNSRSTLQAMNSDASRSSLKYITTQTCQNDQSMLFQVTAAGTALSINYRTKHNTDW